MNMTANAVYRISDNHLESMFCPMYIYPLSFVFILELQISKITPLTTIRGKKGFLKGFSVAIGSDTRRPLRK
jgi:hypothetical protein